MKVIFLLACLLGAALCDIGVDLSTSTDQSAFSCLVGQGYSYTVVRCFMSVGYPDSSCAGSVAAAWAGGMSTVDIYFFPCPTCGNAAGQVSQMASYIQSNGVKFNTLWFDIEGGSDYWMDVNSNVAFFEDLLSAAQGQGWTLGVYTSESQWPPIMGSYSGGSSLPLWYANYDGQQNFNDFSGFNGWNTPVRKQFASPSGSVCGAGVDLNWSPGGSTGTASGYSSSSGGANAGDVPLSSVYNQLGGKRNEKQDAEDAVGNEEHFRLAEEIPVQKFY